MSNTALAWLDAAVYAAILLAIGALFWIVLRRPHVPFQARERERAREHAWKCFRAFLAAMWEVARS